MINRKAAVLSKVRITLIIPNTGASSEKEINALIKEPIPRITVKHMDIIK